MNNMEKAALQHALAELKYQSSKQAKIDLEIDKERRKFLDIKNNHSPLCSLTKCHPECHRFKCY